MVARRRPHRGAAEAGARPSAGRRRRWAARHRLVRGGGRRSRPGDGRGGIAGTLPAPLPHRPARPHLPARGRARPGLDPLGRHRRAGTPQGHRLLGQPRRPGGQRVLDSGVAGRGAGAGQGRQRPLPRDRPAGGRRGPDRLGAESLGRRGPGHPDHRVRRRVPVVEQRRRGGGVGARKRILPLRPGRRRGLCGQRGGCGGS